MYKNIAGQGELMRIACRNFSSLDADIILFHCISFKCLGRYNSFILLSEMAYCPSTSMVSGSSRFMSWTQLSNVIAGSSLIGDSIIASVS